MGKGDLLNKHVDVPQNPEQLQEGPNPEVDKICVSEIGNIIQPIPENDQITFIVNLDLQKLSTVTPSFANMKHDDWNNLQLKYPDTLIMFYKGHSFLVTSLEI